MSLLGALVQAEVFVELLEIRISIREVSIRESAFKKSAFVKSAYRKSALGKSALGNSALGKSALGKQDGKMAVQSHSGDSVMRGGAEEGRSNAQG
jgi:hypothetical protein